MEKVKKTSTDKTEKTKHKNIDKRKTPRISIKNLERNVKHYLSKQIETPMKKYKCCTD